MSEDVEDFVARQIENSDKVVSISDHQATPDMDTSEGALGELFASRHHNEFRHVAQWGRWMHWDGRIWKEDLTHLVRDRAYGLAKQVANKFARELEAKLNSAISPEVEPSKKREYRDKNKVTAQHKSRKFKTVKIRNNLLSMASPNRLMAASVDQWDNDNWLLNTPDCVLDLRDFSRADHNPKNYITMMTRVSPENMPIPRWERFLSEITDGDRDLQEYMQRVFGYSLTGETSEQAIFFGYGTGGNGKSIVINTIAEILGDYHKTASMDTFIASPSSRHPTELAYLRGSRFVTAVETEVGRRWNESRIKVLTGGEKITARFMREDFFEFEPHFKIFVIGNHKPHFRAVDEAIRRRFQLVPFTVTIPTNRRDKHLFEKLKPEWPGILHWLIEGCQKWRAEGVCAPKSVLDATEEYLTSEDPTTQWFKQCCIKDPNSFVSTSDLFESWSKWATKNEELIGTTKTLRSNLTARKPLFNIESIRRRHARGFSGLRLRDQPEEVETDE